MRWKAVPRMLVVVGILMLSGTMGLADDGVGRGFAASEMDEHIRNS